MAGASNYTETRVLDFFLKANSLSTTAPSAVYVALFNSDDSAGATAENLEAGILSDECQGGGYQRQAVTFGTIDTTAGTVSNSGAITFPAATDGNWSTITHVAIIDSQTQYQDGDSAGQGNVIFYGELTTARDIQNNDTFQISDGQLTVTLA